MKVVASHFIGDHQTCAFPGWRAADNLFLLRDLICYARLNNLCLVIESINLEKALDKIFHGFLWNVLEKIVVLYKS